MTDEALRHLGVGTGEPLHPDLVPHVRDGAIGMMVLSHPLVLMVPYVDGFSGWANQLYARKLAALADYEERGVWNGYIWAHERPYRCEAFERIADHLTDAEYWKLLRQVWVDSENVCEMAELWRDLFAAQRRGRSKGLMTPAERTALRELPDVIDVWRGVRRRADAGGLSWTTDRDKARWFADRTIYPGRPIVLRGTVAKCDVIAYVLTRGESEIISDDVVQC